jgi:hypothetical protein
MEKKTDADREDPKSHKTVQKDRPNLIPGLDPAALARQLNERLPAINAVIERKEKSQLVTQEIMLLEFNY